MRKGLFSMLGEGLKRKMNLFIISSKGHLPMFKILNLELCISGNVKQSYWVLSSAFCLLLLDFSVNQYRWVVKIFSSMRSAQSASNYSFFVFSWFRTFVIVLLFFLSDYRLLFTDHRSPITVHYIFWAMGISLDV